MYFTEYGFMFHLSFNEFAATYK